MKNPVPRSFALPALFLALLAIAYFVSRPDPTPIKEAAVAEVTGAALAPTSPAFTASAPAAPAPLATPVLAMNAPTAAIPLFKPPGTATGTKVDPRAPSYRQVSTTAKPVGRAAVVDRAGFTPLSGLVAGDSVSLPLMDGKVAAGRVDVVKRDRTWTRIGGDLENGNGRFALASNGATVSGLIMLKREKLAYVLEEQKDGKLWMLEKAQADVVCSPLPPAPEPKLAPREGPAEAVPILNSRPGAAEVIYLDFDGEVVTDTLWGNINAASYNFSATTITAMYDRVKEDFMPFNINVTTDVANYNTAAVGHRMKVIMTPTTDAAPGAGGVAYLTSFRNAGSGSFDPDIPCWVFNSGIVGCSEAISHEVGHTLGLIHDGRNTPSEGYYQGHGSGATGWAPIMGVGYYKNLVQWSKGEYTSANNTENDLAIITASNNHFGYAPDDAGNTRASANALSGSPTTGLINQPGLIERTGDNDFYTFFTNGGPATISATSPSSSPNLDIVLELQDAAGAVLQTNNPATALNASVSATLAQGQYFVRVSPTGTPTPPLTGYTTYGSIGQYALGGTVQGLTQNPIVTSASTANGQVGASFSYRIVATGNPASFAVTGTLPGGLAVDTANGYILGFPTEAGSFPVVVSATNGAGTGMRNVTIIIADATLTLGEAVDFPSLSYSTTPAAPWVGQKAVFYQPAGPALTDGDAAQAAVIGDGEETSFTTSVTGPATLEFRWKVASEQNGDYLILDVDGTELQSISGVVDWTLVSVPLDANPHVIKWIYRKNATFSDSPDTGWVDDVKFNSTSIPVITSATNATGTVGNAFAYQIVATNIPWSYSLDNLTPLPLGLKLDPVTGRISGLPAVVANTTVNLTATNNIGDSLPLALTISIAASPISIADALDDVTSGAYATATTPPGSAEWFPETAITHDGTDAMQSGPIGPNQQTSITKTVSGIETVNFWWKAESLPAGNRARFFVNNVPKAVISGITEWENVSVFVGTGSHNLEWRYEKDASGTLGADAVWLDQVTLTTDLLPVITSGDKTGNEGVPLIYQIVANGATAYASSGLPDGLSMNATGSITGIPSAAGIFPVTIEASNLAGTATKNVIFTIIAAPVSLAQAVEASIPPKLIWTTDPTRPWQAQTSFSFDGLHAAKSGALPQGGISSIETHANGPVTITFRWTVDSEANHDFLRFYIDGDFKAQISGQMSPAGGPANWELRTYILGPGDHTLRWDYSKDFSTAVGRDSGWLDAVTLVAGSALPVISSPLTATAYLGRPFKYQAAATNVPLTYSAAPLPANLVFDSNTGMITGTPTAEGTTTVQLAATNAQGPGPASPLVLTVVPEPAGADNFANATALSGVVISIEGTNAFATAETGEPAHGGRPAKASIWYAWTAPLTGVVNVSTAGSSVDTLLSVYEGTALNNLVVVTENDDAGKVVSSAVKFKAVGGRTYRFAVDSLNGASGKIMLNVMYAATGLYTGLLEDPNGGAAPGLATIKLTSKFGFSGFIEFGEDKTGLKGSFTGENFTGFIERKKNQTPLNVALNLNLSPGAEEITGTVIADGVTFNLFAKLALSKADVLETLPGSFTFIIEPDDIVTAGLPRGTGYGTATVSKAGKVKTNGFLGDGTKFTGGGTVAIDKSFVLYLTPYKGGGVFAGEILIDGGGLFPPLSSQLDWTRAADAKAKTFAAGFGPTTATLKGYRYVKPPKGTTMLILNKPALNLDFTFTNGDLLPVPPNFTATLDTANKLSGAPAGFECKFNTATGLFSGSLLDSTGVEHDLGGAILQSVPAQGAGLFFGTANTGTVTLTPTP